ncbi:MAG: UDP-N-acetylmuramate dehydrogenase [Saprospiraceae bacterium]|nr:UDP-N-acetylmuramate dehydrogenase [Saprospiraceae bacterium]
MRKLDDISLKSYNTFHIDAQATHLTTIEEESELKEFLNHNRKAPLLILGAGSNVLFTKERLGNVLHVNWKGMTIIEDGEDSIEVRVAAGEVWHHFVLWALANNYGGVENLSLIPGKVGATPIQNIGAYGVEVKDVITYVNGIFIDTGEVFCFDNATCRFGYRDSIFKNELKGKIIITSVQFKLSKRNHKIRCDYGAIKQQLQKNHIAEPYTIQDVSKAVIEIRESKLPNPEIIGNAGSFFKNPEIDLESVEKLKNQYPQLVVYPIDGSRAKIPAAWLIEQCGWKGWRHADIGCHKDQALVLVNYGDGKGQDIFQLAQNIQKSVQERFNIHLEMEVNII